MNLNNFDVAFAPSFSDGLPHLDIKNNLASYLKISFNAVDLYYVTTADGAKSLKRVEKAMGYVNCTSSRFLNQSVNIAMMGLT